MLLHLGLQLAARSPQVFATDRLELTIRQRLGTLGQDASAVGLEVRRLIGSPFRRAALEIIQEVERAEGRVTGLRVGEWVTDPRLIPLDDLQHLALFDPAATLRREAPDVRIVLPIDALDELRYQDPEGNLLAWLANLPPLPANLRLVLTSRPDDDLLRTLRRKQADQLRELFLDLDNPEVGAGIHADLTAYAHHLIQSAPVAGALATVDQPPAAFAAAAVAKAGGNLGYLDALARGIDQALTHPDDKALRALLALRELPDELEGLYAFFLQQLKAGVSRQSVEVEDPESGEVHYLPAWPAVYRRLLGVLAVALAPLAPAQIKALGGIAAGQKYLTEALDRLRQFLDVMNGRYRLYHATVAEFLTAAGTREHTDTADLYVDPIRWHRQIAGYYWKRYRDDWQRCDPYGLTNLATHLFESGDADGLAALISKAWMQARYARGGYTYTGFLADVELAWQAVLTPGEEATNLLTLVRLQAVRQFVGQAVSVYSDTDLHTLVWLGREAEALAHARLREEPAEQCKGLLALHDALQAASRPDQALLDEVRTIAGAIQVDHERAEVLHPLAVALAQVGRYAEAEEVAQSIQDAHVQAKAIGDLAVVLAQAGHFDQAGALVRATADDEERARALREVAMAFAQAGEGQAGQMFAEAEQAARSIENTALQAKALHALVATLARVATYDEAHRIAHTFEDTRHQAGALIDLASALAQTGDRRAPQVFTEAEEAAQVAQFDSDRAEALIDLAAALAQAGDGRAGEMFARAEAAAPRRAAFDSGSRAPVLGKLAVALAQAGDPRADRVFAEAQDIARDLEALYEVEWRDWKDQAFRALAADLLKAGRYDEVKNVVSSMQIEAERATVLHDLAKALVQAGRYGEAEDVANGIPSDRVRARALGDLAAALARTGDSQAGRVFAEAEAAARSEYSSPRAPTLQHVAMALVQAQRYAAAEAVARAIADPQEQARALYGLVAPFTRAQRYAAAAATARAIADNKVQAQALHDLSVALAESERFDEAEALARAIPEREQGWTWSDFEDLIEDRAWVQADRVEAALHIA
ncbi:MAG: hypothetical protein M5U01_00275 [Ardenticatenaceae bacterium]|nr:hypothetical protein [Ardenticatenaceae bacterium]